MMEAWARDKQHVDRYNAQISALVSLVPGLRVREATILADQREATDMVLERVHIACRVRKFGAYARYRHQFTMRSARGSGSETELLKVASGHAQLMFYGFADAADCNLYAASVLDLDVFRKAYSLELLALANAHIAGYEYRQQVRRHHKPNPDGSSDFLAFDIDSFPGGLIVAQWPANHHKVTHSGIDWATLLDNRATLLLAG